MFRDPVSTVRIGIERWFEKCKITTYNVQARPIQIDIHPGSHAIMLKIDTEKTDRQSDTQTNGEKQREGLSIALEVSSVRNVSK